MKKILTVLTKILDKIYSIGILVCLFGGGLTFFGFLAAFIIGGETATEICVYIQNQIFKWLIYGGNVIICLGLVNMYLKKQKSLTVSDENREAN